MERYSGGLEDRMLFRDNLTRSRVVAARRAADFGADRPYHNTGDYWTWEQCDAMRELLLGLLASNSEFILGAHGARATAQSTAGGPPHVPLRSPRSR